ncbi:Por secretion system C-terminal sorting domain-containing protein [Hymenobacter gelipurpurascens]|uniref:Por secretion system C-terminal sorting domain-containing protein n=2 Tax=Hymenobacter gelipurpurascens TaxID=89968 RepID=A0A212T2Z4_9BACT|nr:Por secretion system C-terminal sorting domain-containing protein [Hymenobacter gelipurpurascens]
MHPKLVLLVVAFVYSVMCLPSANATTYYISSAGNDAAEGKSVATAWQSIERVNAARFEPGDRILFEAGQTFEGSIWLQSKGTKASPLRIGSYGQGMATINSGNNYGFYAANVGGIELHRMKFVGSGRLTTNNSGIIFTTDLANERLDHLVLDSLDVSGYLKSGIILGSSSATSGYDNVRITNCLVHENGEAGISSYSAYPLLSHRNWYLGKCKTYDNAGRKDITYTHTGNGIVLSGIDGAVVEQCEAFNNGWLNSNPGGGPVGIWGWLCNNLVIQDCESHHNRSGLAHDGGGFDLDGGCTNSVLQYNYSHDNDGAGYLLAQFDGAPAMHDLTVRYNISENDARRFGQGAIMLWSSGANGGIQRAAIYNNSVFITPASDGSEAKAFYQASGGVSQITVRNNIFQTTNGLAQVQSLTTTGLQLQGNCYWGTEKPMLVKWGGSAFNSLSTWRDATGQERVGDQETGFNVDPAFTSAGDGGDMNTMLSGRLQTSWHPYKLQSGSALIGKGLNLTSAFSTAIGSRDFYGSATPTSGATGNLGAIEEDAKKQPLPVELVSFTAERQGNQAVLRWTTASELQNSHFDVETSIDGRSFRHATTVAGRGTTAQHTSYSWVDALAGYAAEVVYYRLVQVDQSGKQTYSSVRSVELNTTVGLSMTAWPNPSAGEVTIQIQSPVAGKASITCTDALGRTVFNRLMDVNKGNLTMPLPEVAQLPQGVYRLTMQQGGQQVTAKLLHQ